MTSTKPTPQSWTVRLKHHRTTILLHIDPLAPLGTLKSELLSALQQTHPDGTFHDSLIPQKANDILLAKPVDINDLSAGWESIESSGGGDDAGNAKGKGKVGGGGKKGGLEESAKGVGLRDGGMVAFKFRQSKDGNRGAMVDEVDLGDGLIDVEDNEEEVEKWDVVVPTVEETYGAELPVVGDGVDEVG